jgi:hypothetical protein
MEFLLWLVILALIMGYLNLALILFREKPVINIYNKLPEEKSYESLPADKTAIFFKDRFGTAEIPIESNVTVKDLYATVNIDSEKIKSENVSDLVNKIKNVRGK